MNSSPGIQPQESMDVVYISIETVVALVSVLGNSWWGLRNTTFFFIVSLAVADIAVGFLVIPLAIVISLEVKTQFYTCLFLSCLLLIITQSSILSLLAIAIDRYLRVKIPTKYSSIVTQERAWAAVSLCWVLSFLTGMVPMTGWNNRGALSPSSSIPCTFTTVMRMDYMVYFNFFGWVVVPLAIMIFLYVEIFRVIKRQLNSRAEATCDAERNISLIIAETPMAEADGTMDVQDMEAPEEDLDDEQKALLHFNIKAILGSVGIEADDERLNKVVSELNGKDINEVMNSGLSKLASVPAGSAVAAPAAAAGAAGAGAAPAISVPKASNMTNILSGKPSYSGREVQSEGQLNQFRSSWWNCWWILNWSNFIFKNALRGRLPAVYSWRQLQPSAKDIKAILGSVGIEADERTPEQGLSKLASVPAGSAVAAPAAAAGAAGAGAAPAVAEEKRKRRKKNLRNPMKIWDLDSLINLFLFCIKAIKM
ncbi:hypothetical protein WMY93_012208 [Mugilogobius chulae]|uniref:Large ribosomal subunit protein P2 n=1 Tax=Mugilogobius chulae TaxID=88201 RepID=A0AAW0PDN8_9GOBI